jgi:DNA-binding winged helix-turn-helix (wHTH) protein
MKPVLEFGPFRLNGGSGALHRDGAPVPLGQRASALLLALVERRDQTTCFRRPGPDRSCPKAT